MPSRRLCLSFAERLEHGTDGIGRRDALEPYYAGDVLALHHDKHHASYVTGADRALEQLDRARVAGDYGAVNALVTDAALQLQGSGWAALVWEPTAGRLLVEQIHDHQDNAICGALRVRSLRRSERTQEGQR